MSCTGGCSNGPNGGVFVGSSATVMLASTRCRAAEPSAKLAPGPGASETSGPEHGAVLPLEQCAPQYVAQYTTDGSDPTSSPTAKAYTKPFDVPAPGATVRAVIVVNGTVRPLVHNATFAAART